MVWKLILQLLFGGCLYLMVDAQIRHENYHQTSDNDSELSNCSVDFCLNGGTCFNGTCICPAEFSGRLCEIRQLCETQWIWDAKVKNHVHPPVCFPVCRFPRFEPPLLSKWALRYADMYNWIVTEIEFECDTGYLLIGPHQLRCVSDGKWDREVPKCQPICSDPGTPPHGIRLNARRIKEIFTTGTSVTFQCHQGYYLNGAETINCTEAGEWSADVPQCLPVTLLASQVESIETSIKSQSMNFPVIDNNVYSPSNETVPPDRLLRLIRPKYLDKELTTTSKPLIKSSNILLGSPSVICGFQNESQNSSESTAWPWQATLLAYDKFGENYIICGGNLISDRWVITAAHCVSQLGKRKSYPADYFKVVLGMSVREEPGSIEMDIKNIFIHPNYHPKSNDSDIALIELNEAAELSDTIYPICLPPPLTHLNTIKALNYELPHGTRGRVAGWGSLWDSSPPEQLKIFRMEVVNREFCEEDFSRSVGTYVTITSNMFCAQVVQPGDHGACRDDGGGSFAVQQKNEGTKQWVLHGIVSMGAPNCGPRYTIFVNLPHYVPWIRDTLELN